jgi:hypothetical protein
MSIEFDPPELGVRFHRAALEYLSRTPDESDWHLPRPLPNGSWEENGDEYPIVSAELEISLPGLWDHSEGTAEVPCSAFIALVDEALAAKAIGHSVLRCPGRTIMAVEPADLGAHYFAAEYVRIHEQLQATHQVNSVECKLSFTKDLNPFHLYRLWSKDERFSDWLPPMESDQDQFLVLEHPKGFVERDAVEMLWAFLFEVSASVGATWEPRRFLKRDDPEEIYTDLDENVVELADGRRPIRLFPLSTGRGLFPLYKAFLEASNGALPVEYQILEYAKVLEYVSASVVRQDLHSSLMGALRDPRTLHPDADYLDDLTDIVEKNRLQNKRDAGALRLTLEKCTDHRSIARTLPAYVTAKCKSNATVEDQIVEFAKCVVATRNQIAHAKATYTPTGDEAPVDLQKALVLPLRLAALSSIRWFAALEERLRVVPRWGDAR